MTNKITVCGAIHVDGDYSPVYVNNTTGECFFRDATMGDSRLIAEVSVGTPTEIDYEGLVPMMEDGTLGDCIGIIYNGDTVIKLLTESTAVTYNTTDPDNTTSKVFTIDINCDYDDDDEDVDDEGEDTLL